ncbi:hypothetical protein Y023_5247 [Burkholderia pseudomallei A79D]|nr:hypothetical protein X992_5214 [Burkholderia pseudomallei MSHR5492]KGX95871.1 hypothetical protein Y023_5247 [Burkholderia pseudomallei A79D]KGX96915.1 hypothetical protein X997_4927 [Burkholderia pseudomallei A79C]
MPYAHKRIECVSHGIKLHRMDTGERREPTHLVQSVRLQIKTVGKVLEIIGVVNVFL